jgi:hypothetical protein
MTPMVTRGQTWWMVRTPRFNFNPYLDFSVGGTRTLEHTTAANTILTAQQSIIGVFYKTTDGQTLVAMDNGAQDGGLQSNVIDTRGNTSDYYYRGSVTNVPSNEVHFIGGGEDVAGNSQMDVLYDGKLTINSTASAASLNATLTAGTVMVGRGLNSPFTGYSPEIIAYTGKLSPVEFQRISSYLAIKYGVTLDQTSNLDYLASDASGATIWDATCLLQAINNGIAGIGRDDCSGLEQKQSKSRANSDALITMGNGNTIASYQTY